MNRLVYLPDAVTLQFDREKCNGCGMCIKVCPHAVFAMINKKAVIVGREYCMECGACAKNCSEDALSVRAGVGCAAALIAGTLRHSEPTCGCSAENSSLN
ncbi:MAG TPA: mercury methylation ferredoxin HgcB [Bacteroidota bacterium]|nr:mercury methylation ferredoxin HgcB [Bacteroidota bacterium]